MCYNRVLKQMNRLEALRAHFGEVLNRRNSTENGNLMTSMFVCTGVIIGALGILLEGPRVVDVTIAAIPTAGESLHQGLIYVNRMGKQEREEKLKAVRAKLQAEIK